MSTERQYLCVDVYVCLYVDDVEYVCAMTSECHSRKWNLQPDSEYCDVSTNFIPLVPGVPHLRRCTMHLGVNVLKRVQNGLVLLEDYAKFC